MSYNARREKSTFKKERVKNSSWEKRGGERREGSEETTVQEPNPGRREPRDSKPGFGQPMLPAGQRDKRPRKNHIMTESRGTLSGNTSGGYNFFVRVPAAG